MRYVDRLKQRIESVNSRLCVGLDPRPEYIKEGVSGIEHFLKEVINETGPYAAAFKPNMAYFEALGVQGIILLESILQEIPSEVPVILDAKRSDIGETQRYYARSYFEHWGVDAVTLNPFLGYDTLEPFLGYEEKGVYLLAVTSNAGSQDFQQQVLSNGRCVYELVGDLCQRAHEEGRATDAGLVLGLTNMADSVFNALPDVPLLIPGLGAQGGDLSVLRTCQKTAPFVVNVSRGILYGKKPYRDLAQSFSIQIEEALRPEKV